MSYCRFGWDGSDVYVFESVNQGGSLECCGCGLDPTRSGQWNWKNVAEFLRHLETHRAAGHTVPDNVAPEIVRDWWAGVFAEWDQTDPNDMAPFQPLLETKIEPVPLVDYLERNRHMLGASAEEIIEVLREKEE